MILALSIGGRESNRLQNSAGIPMVQVGERMTLGLMILSTAQDNDVQIAATMNIRARDRVNFMSPPSGM